MDLISVIIPIYQVEAYIEACVETVKRQTYKNLEIILIDDGSTDNGSAICDALAEKDDRIIVIHKEYEGVAEARNVGLNAAKGKYITFVDSDDSIDLSMIEILYNALKKTDTLVSVCGFCRCKKQKLVCEGKLDTIPKVCDSVDFLYNTRNWFPWGKLYDRRVFKKKRFVKGQIYEDVYLVPQILMDCKNLAVVKDKPLYHYNQRSNSIMGKTKSVIGADHSRNMFFMETYAKRKYGERNKKYKKILAIALRAPYNRLAAVKNPKDPKNAEFVQIFRRMIKREWRNIIFNYYLSVRERYSCFLLLLSVTLGVDSWVDCKS